MTSRQKARHSSRYLTRQLASAHQVLSNPKATDAQRHGARCRLNRTLRILRGLASIPAMKHGLVIDVLPRVYRPAVSRAG